MLNSEKNKILVLGPKNLRDSMSTHIAALDGITLASSTTVRNLGVIFDQDLVKADDHPPRAEGSV